MKRLGSKLLDLRAGGGVVEKREKFGLIMGNSKVYYGGHKTATIDRNKHQ